MKETYTLTIEATGPHHQGHTTGNLDHDADHQLKSLVQKLQATGHIVHLATFQIPGVSPEFIAGSVDDMKSLCEAEPTPEPILETILGELREHRAEFKKFAVHEKKAAKPPRGKKEEGGAKEDAEPGNDTPPSTGTEAPAPTPEPQEPGSHGEPDAPTTPEP